MFTIHQLTESFRAEQTCHKSSPEKKKMGKSNPDKSYGWYKAQDFGDYIERVVGEITIKFISIIPIILTTTLRITIKFILTIITTLIQVTTGRSWRRGSSRTRTRPTTTTLLSSALTLSGTVSSSILNITIVRMFTLTLSPEYQVKQEEDHPRTDTALVNVDVLDTVLLSLHPESKVKASEISERTKEGLKELHCFSALIHLDDLTKADMKDLLESLPNRYSSQLGQFSTC